MKIRFFQTLAWDGIRKNRKLYLPYLLACTCMVAMVFILRNLCNCSMIEKMKGSGSVQVSLTFGSIVVSIFALIFLFYTNTFLIRTRSREFGLYHILGMGKKGIRRIIFWESLIVAVSSMAFGMALGALLSKLAELCLARILREETDYSFAFPTDTFLFTGIIFGGIFLLLMLRALISVQRSRSLELFGRERVGEKPPKANWLIALSGAALLGTAYYMAVSIQSPLEALAIFFIAVILVILATYLLFTAGSVTLCRLLQGNPKYYYQKQHFVSVSSMAFRMRRNGAGLASICILSTMVLVMLSSTGSLYFGMEENIENRYAREIAIAVMADDLGTMSEESIGALRKEYETVIAQHGYSPEHVIEHRYAEIVGLLGESAVQADHEQAEGVGMRYLENLRQLVFLEADAYNRIMGTELHPGPGEAYVLPKACRYQKEELSMNGLHLKILGELSGEFPGQETISAYVTPILYLVVGDLSEVTALTSLRTESGERMLIFKWNYEFDLSGASDEEAREIYRDCKNRIHQREEWRREKGGYGITSYCKAQDRKDFIATYGGLFFLGILLSFIFLLAAVLIIYYKQISEGYEDRARFEIMQKVGMSGKDIQRSVNSQMLTVFFAPLLLAGVHLAFAFPLLWKILSTMMFMKNLAFAIEVTLAAYAVFGVFYLIVYKLTAGAYYHIVSD